MKKIFVLMLAMSLLMSICGCTNTDNEKNKSDTADNDLTTEISSESSSENKGTDEEFVMKSSFKRVKSVTISTKTSDGATESRTYEIKWNGDLCTFTMIEIGLVEMGFNDETNELYMHRMSETSNENSVDSDILCTFDDVGRVTSLGAELPDVEYDENGWPTGDYVELIKLKINPAKMEYSIPFSGTGSEEYISTNYAVYTIDESGFIVKSDMLSVTTHRDTGVTEETLDENFQTFTYDNGGNLIKYEWFGATFEFTYTDEIIHHPWERIVPFLCCNQSYLYIMPIFWNLK